MIIGFSFSLRTPIDRLNIFVRHKRNRERDERVFSYEQRDVRFEIVRYCKSHCARMLRKTRFSYENKFDLFM